MYAMKKTGRRSTRQPRQERIALRAGKREAELIRAAAEAAGLSVTEFVLRSASTAAESALADRTRFTLDAVAWKKFVAVLDRPARDLPRLRRLFEEPTLLHR